jgi:hypothetical protein
VQNLLLFSSAIFEHVKVTLHGTKFLPVVLYCVKLGIFYLGRNTGRWSGMLRKIFGPQREEVTGE